MEEVGIEGSYRSRRKEDNKRIANVLCIFKVPIVDVTGCQMLRDTMRHYLVKRSRLF